MSSNFFLKGDKVFLRAPDGEDLDFFVTIKNDLISQMLLMSAPKPLSKQQVSEWLTNAQKDERRFMFLILEADHPSKAIGYLQLANFQPIHGTVELGVCILPEMRGQGIGREAIKLILKFAYQIYAIRKVGLKVLSQNSNAIALYRKLGFRKVGILREDFWICGKYQDVMIMEKIVKDSCK